MRLRLGRAGLLLALGLAYGTPVQSQSILYYSDLDLGTSSVPGALTMLGLTATTATSTAQFGTLLSGGSWDLVMFGHHNYSSTATDVMTQLTSYMSGGGKLLAATWGTSPLPGFMEAVAQQTDVSPIYTDSHPIFAGLGPSIGLLPGLGWGIWSQSYSPVGAAQCLGTLGSYCAGVLGHGGRSLLLGPLFDTYADLGQGEQFVAQSAKFLLGDVTAVPEPATLLMLIPGLLGIAVVRRRQGERQ